MTSCASYVIKQEPTARYFGSLHLFIRVEVLMRKLMKNCKSIMSSISHRKTSTAITSSISFFSTLSTRLLHVDTMKKEMPTSLS